MNCPNLKCLFGKHYRIRVEESHKAERGTEIKRAVDPWLYEIPCKYGSIYPWTKDRIAASIEGHPKMANKVRQIIKDGEGWLQVEQDGDYGELTVSFLPEHHERIFPLMVPRYKAQLDEEERARRAAVLARNRATSK